MDSLYRNAAETPVEAPFVFDSHILAEALKNLYKRKYDPKKEIDPLLFSEISRILGKAVDEGFGNSDIEDEFIRQLKSSTEVFSAFKTHRMGRDMAAKLLDDKGQLKSYRQFQKDVLPIASHHIDNWLKTEYNTAVRRAHLAADFERYKRNADILPNLRWEPSTSVNKRELHIPFYDRVWAIDDPFWADNFPGSLWNCKCGISPTDDPLTDNSGIITLDVKPHKGLDGNPAVTGQIFSDDHPYHPTDCRHCPFGKVKPLQIINAKKDCHNCGKIQAVIQDAEEKAKQRRKDLMKLHYLKVKDKILNQYGFNSVITIPVGSQHCTGQLKLTPESLKLCLRGYAHTRNIDSKYCLLKAIQNPGKLRHRNYEALGARKDLSDPIDAQNVKRKADRGVTGYNFYEFDYKGKTWILGFEVIKGEYEQPYFVALK